MFVTMALAGAKALVLVIAYAIVGYWIRSRLPQIEEKYAWAFAILLVVSAALIFWFSFQ